MKKSVQEACAEDYLSQFTPTKSISRYSPIVSALAGACKRCYPAEGGGVYDIRDDHIVEAAKGLGLPMQRGTKGQLQIGISAEEFNAKKTQAVFSEEFVCQCGFAPYSYYLADRFSTPLRRACCSRCPDGYKRPSKSDIKNAKAYLVGKQTNSSPGAGALILAARELKFTISKPIAGKLRLSRKSQN